VQAGNESSLLLIVASSTGIDTLRKKYTVLSPSPGKLPSTVAIAGGIEWVDSA
jgi:polyribonucleotide 5'-hydroxyl-kinase